MKKRCAIFAIVCLTLLISMPASAASPVGKWSVSGVLTATGKASGGYSISQRIKAKDMLNFKKDGTFEMTDMSGTWRQKKGKFYVYLSIPYIEQYVERFISNYGYDAEVNIQSLVFSGTATGSKISGKLTIKAAFSVTSDSTTANGTVNFSWPFSGRKKSPSAVEAQTINEKTFMRALEEYLPQVLLDEALSPSAPLN